MKRGFIPVLFTVCLALAACGPISISANGPSVSIEEGMTAAVGTLQAGMTATAALATQQAALIDTAVAATLQAGQNAATPVPNAATSGSISGSVPGPKMARVVAFAVGSNAYYSLELSPGQVDYQLDFLPPGQYYVMAYGNASQYAVGPMAAYSQYVLCGMTAACTDHALVPVTVQAARLTSDIDPLDTFQMPNFPPDPFGPAAQGPQPTAPTGSDVIPTQTPPGGLVGSISGNAQYPAQGLPPLAVIAFRVGVPNEYYYIQTAKGQGGYQIDNLPVGKYTVVAYTLGGGGIPTGLAGGYTQYVICGMAPPCSNHALMEVTVNAGQVTGNVNPADWYMLPGTYPAYPLP